MFHLLSEGIIWVRNKNQTIIYIIIILKFLFCNLNFSRIKSSNSSQGKWYYSSYQNAYISIAIKYFFLFLYKLEISGKNVKDFILYSCKLSTKIYWNVSSYILILESIYACFSRPRFYLDLHTVLMYGQSIFRK